MSQIMKTKADEHVRDALQAPNLRAWVAELVPAISNQIILA
jgi:hypothetical protein